MSTPQDAMLKARNDLQLAVTEARNLLPTEISVADDYTSTGLMIPSGKLT